jgi:hypothetical protein
VDFGAVLDVCGCPQVYGLIPTPRHFSPIIRLLALGGAFKQAESLLSSMYNSTLREALHPDTESCNSLLMVRSSFLLLAFFVSDARQSMPCMTPAPSGFKIR